MSGPDDVRSSLGHNGGPPLDDTSQRPTLPAGASCRSCRHWRAPPEAEERNYEAFRLGLSRRRVRRPSGACDRVVLGPGRPPAFSATSAEFVCLNFEQRPPAPPRSGGGYVTIYEGGRIVWQGPEERLPSRFQQDELDLPEGPSRGRGRSAGS